MIPGTIVTIPTSAPTPTASPENFTTFCDAGHPTFKPRLPCHWEPIAVTPTISRTDDTMNSRVARIYLRKISGVQLTSGVSQESSIPDAPYPSIHPAAFSLAVTLVLLIWIAKVAIFVEVLAAVHLFHVDLKLLRRPPALPLVITIPQPVCPF